jgi:sigma-B regulation protein RsbU (phosphoserine phosphatase)
MKIRYKISILVILLTVAIILLINFSYVKIVTWAADEFVERYLRRQMTSVLVDVPPENEIDWDDMQAQIDRTLQESNDLLYVAVYNAATDEARLVRMNVDQVRPLMDSKRDMKNPQKIIDGFHRGDVDIKDAREIEIFAQSDPPSTSLRVVIGYIFPISDRVRSFITWVALVLIFTFTVVAILGSSFLAGGITKPIRRLASAMQNVSEGDLDTAVRVRSRDEVGQLARVFNKMMYQLKEKTSELEQLNRTLEERVERGVAELRRRDEAENKRLLDEIQRAREVQMGLFPQSPPQIEGLDIWGVCRPANEVGGDFFDYLSLGTGKSCLALGDVSGKGLKGAMNALMAYGMLHVQARTYSSAATIISELNAALSSRLEETTFTTLSLGIIDTRLKQIQLCNAGNPYPVLLREGKASLLELSGMPLGIIPEVEYDETQLALIPGDVLVFYSDGISEATTSDERMYGMDALKELVGTFQPGMRAQSIVERILQEVRKFVGDFPQSDDMTIIALRVHGVP